MSKQLFFLEEGVDSVLSSLVPVIESWLSTNESLSSVCDVLYWTEWL